MKKIKVAIFGGSGYGGAELLRILLLHPHAEIMLVTANEHAGKSVGEVHRNLYGLTGLRFDSMPEDVHSLHDVDCIFLALPHGQALEIAPRLVEALPDVRLIDLSGDFRLRDAEEFRRQATLRLPARSLQPPTTRQLSGGAPLMPALLRSGFRKTTRHSRSPRFEGDDSSADEFAARTRGLTKTSAFCPAGIRSEMSGRRQALRFGIL